MTGMYQHPLALLRARLGVSAAAYLRLVDQQHRRLGFGAMATRREKVTRWQTGQAVPERSAQMAMAALHRVPAEAVDRLGWPAWLTLAIHDAEHAQIDDAAVLDAAWDLPGTVISTRSLDQGGAVDRRGFLIATGTTVTSIVASWGEALGRHPATSTTGRRQLTPATLDRLDQRLNDLRHLDDELGGAQLIRAAETEFDLMSTLADQATYPSAVGHRLFGTLAEASRLCGWLHFDAGHHAAAQRFYITALRASATGGAAEVGANTLAFMAIQSYSVGNPNDAVSLARTALERVGTRTTPRVRAMLHARLGRALSKTGDIHGCARHLDTARTNLDGTGVEADPSWAYWFTLSEIDMLAGSCALDLHQPARALVHFAAARQHSYAADCYQRDNALWLARTAEAHLALGDLDQACAVATAAWRQATTLDSTRPTGTLGGFRSALTHGHPGARTHPAVIDFLELTRPSSNRTT